MGWNEGYTIMESQVIALYDLGVMTRDVCMAVLRPFIDTDADSGGMDYYLSKDGKLFTQIAVEMIEPDFNPATYTSEYIDEDDEVEDDEIYGSRFEDLLRDRRLWETSK